MRKYEHVPVLPKIPHHNFKEYRQIPRYSLHVKFHSIQTKVQDRRTYSNVLL